MTTLRDWLGDTIRTDAGYTEVVVGNEPPPPARDCLPAARDLRRLMQEIRGREPIRAQEINT